MRDKDKPELTDSNDSTDAPIRRRRRSESEQMDQEAKARTNRLRARAPGKLVPTGELVRCPPQPQGLVDPDKPKVEILRCAQCGNPIQAKASPDFDEHTRLPIGRFNYLCGECTARGLENGTIRPWQVKKLF